MRLNLRKINQKLIIKIILGLILFYFLFLLGRSFKNSLFFGKKDRINLVFFGPQSTFLSLGLIDNVHYLVKFKNEWLVSVPGGFGRYKIGSLGKLAFLEKKPAIIQKTFSSVTSSYIDFYFLPKKPEVYFNSNWQSEFFKIPKLGFWELIARDYFTNASFFDRLYLFFLLIQKKKTDFSFLDSEFNFVRKNQFSEEDFFKKYQGYFYQKFLRQEKKNLQIYYNNYNIAKLLIRIIEGEGIRVVDLTPLLTEESECQIFENSEKRSQTANFLAKIFKCKIKKGESGLGDIKMILGKRLEKEWE